VRPARATSIKAWRWQSARLTSIAEKLKQIKRSIELRSEPLQDRRETLGTNVQR
jgi:hypothetical protein